MTEDPPALDAYLGVQVAHLILYSPLWVVRIVDSLRFTDSERTRIHSSFDIKIEGDFPRDGESAFLVPLGLYRKGAIRILDMRGPETDPLPVANTQTRALRPQVLHGCDDQAAVHDRQQHQCPDLKLRNGRKPPL